MDSAPQTLAVPARRLRLKNYVYFQQAEDGVWFEAGGRRFTLRGGGVYPLVERCLALMEQGLSLEEIAGRMPERLRGVLRQLVAGLDEHGMLLDLDEAPTPPMPAELLHYLRDQCEPQQWAQRLPAWLQLEVAVLGHGYALKAACAGLLASGVARVHACLPVVSTGPVDAHELALLDGAERLRVHHDASPAADAGLVLVASDAVDGAQAQHWLATATRASACVFAGLVRGQACVLAVAEHPEAGLAALLEQLPEAPADDAEHSPASLAVTGALAAQAVLQRWFAIESEAVRPAHLQRVSPWMEISHHPVLSRASLAPAAALRYPARLGLPADRPLGEYERLRVELDPLFDELTGRFLQHGLPELMLLPLHHELIGVRASAEAAPQWALGWGLDAEVAGVDALCEAVRLLCEQDLPGSTVAVASERARCEARAVAQALGRHALFQRCARVRRIELDALQGVGLQVLRQLLKFHAGEGIELLAYTLEGWPCHLLECRLQGRALARALEPGFEEAMRAVLGAACSALQLKDQLPAGHWLRGLEAPSGSSDALPSPPPLRLRALRLPVWVEGLHAICAEAREAPAA